MPNDYIYANSSARLCLSINAREWSQWAVDYDRPNQITTKMINEDMIFNLNVVPYSRLEDSVAEYIVEFYPNRLENDHVLGSKWCQTE
jgi:hypothetical protein